MEITKLLEQTLKNCNELPAYFIIRERENEECIVYNYIEIPKLMGDMEEIATQYTVLLNLYCKRNIEANKKKVLKAMLNDGFKKRLITSPILEKNGLFNTAMQFSIALKNN